METERKRKFIINTIYFSILAAIFVLVVKFGLPLLTPFVIAFVIAWLLQPLTRWVSGKLKLSQKTAALLLVLLFYCTVGSLIALLAIRAFAGIRGLIALLPSLYVDKIAPILSDLFVGFEGLVFRMDEGLFALIQGYDDKFIQWLGGMISSISTRALGTASGIAAAIPGLFIQIVLTIISTFFIAGDYDLLTGFCLRQMGEKSAALFGQIKQYLVGTLFVCIASYCIIATLTFIELSIGLSILRIDHAVLIAFCIAIFDILPVVGTGGIMIPWAVITLIQGKIPLGLGLLFIYVIVTVVRNIVEPKFVGGKLGLHPVVTLASMFAGAQLLGVIGLFGFPIGLSLMRYLDNSGAIHVFKSAPEA